MIDVDVGFLASYAFSTPFHFPLIYHGPNTISFYSLLSPSSLRRPSFATGGQPEAANRNNPSAEKEHLHGQDVGRGWPTARDTKTDQIASDAQGALWQGLRHALVRRFSITRVSIAGWQAHHMGCIHNEQGPGHTPSFVMGHDLRLRTVKGEPHCMWRS